MEWYEAEVRALEARYSHREMEKRPVVFYGSSSIRLWETLAADFSGEDVLNVGFGGSTLAACVWFFERLVRPRNPHSLVFYAGDNDLGDGRSADQVIGSYFQLMEKVRGQLGPVPFGFISIKPSPARWHLIEAIRKTNEAVREDLARRAGCIYIDVYAAMLDGAGMPRRELFADDGLHLSPAGYAVWRSEVDRYRELLFP